MLKLKIASFKIYRLKFLNKYINIELLSLFGGCALLSPYSCASLPLDNPVRLIFLGLPLFLGFLILNPIECSNSSINND